MKAATTSARDGELQVVPDVPSAFAELVAAELKSSEAPSRLALSGGETARLCYSALARLNPAGLASAEIYLGDERCVPRGDPASNGGMIADALSGAATGPLFEMDCEDLEGYERLLGSVGPMDLVHLGLGPDGHTASLFPASEGLSAEGLVVFNEDPSGLNPHRRMTFTFKEIEAARLVVFTVSGEAKRPALEGVMAGDDLPAARVRAARVVWLVDAPAAGSLRQR